MGTAKKEAVRKERQGKLGDGMANVKVKVPFISAFLRFRMAYSSQGENFYRDAKKVKLLKRLKDGKPQRNAAGTITKAASYQSSEIPNARIEPNRKWFTNSRVISQQSLSAFRDAVAQQSSNPTSFLLKSNKLPMSLIRDNEIKVRNGLKLHKAKMVVETASFDHTFGPKAQRKRPKINANSFDSLASESHKMHAHYLDRLEQAKLLSGNSQATAQDDEEVALESGTLPAPRESIFSKGQSKRIWNELYKVIDSSDG